MRVTCGAVLLHMLGSPAKFIDSPPQNILSLLCSYVGDIFLMGSDDIFRPDLSVREGLEIVVSVGMALPPILKIQ